MLEFREPARTIRYYSPEAEVSFCGHATIATGVVLGRTDGEGTFTLSTIVGDVPVEVRRYPGCRYRRRYLTGQASAR